MKSTQTESGSQDHNSTLRREHRSHHASAVDEQLRFLLTQADGFALCIFDSAGRITSWSAGAERLFGLAATDVIGQFAADLLSEPAAESAAHEPCSMQALLDTARRESFASVQAWFRGAQGRSIWCAGSLTVTSSQEDHEETFCLTLVDLTDVKHREMQCREAQRTAENQCAAKDRMLAMAAHELRTPMASISMWAQLINQGGLTPEEFAEGLQAIQRNAEVQARLIDDLLDSARITSGRLSLKICDFDICVVVAEAINSARPTAAAKRVQLDLCSTVPCLLIHADPDRVRQIVVNLISNSIRFTPSGGTIQVVLATRDAEIEIRVEDNGSGIPHDLIPRLFDAHVESGQKPTSSHGGLGIGLSISRQLVELHGGRLRAESPNARGGSTFIVTLPQQDESSPSAR